MIILRDRDRDIMQQREQQCEPALQEVVGAAAQQVPEVQQAPEPEMSSDDNFSQSLTKELIRRVKRVETPLWGNTDEYVAAYDMHELLVRHTVSRCCCRRRALSCVCSLPAVED